MIAKNLLLFVLNFLLIFPGGVFAQTPSEVDEMMKESADALISTRTNEGGSVDQNAGGIEDENSEVFGYASPREGGHGGNIVERSVNNFNDIFTVVSEQISEHVGGREIYGDYFKNQLRIHQMVKDGVDSRKYNDNGEEKKVELADLKASQLLKRQAMCSSLKQFRFVIMQQAHQYVNPDEASVTDLKKFPHSIDSYFSDIRGFANGYERLENTVSFHNRSPGAVEERDLEADQLARQMLAGLGRAIGQNCRQNHTTASSGYCAGDTDGAGIEEVCNKYFDFVDEPDEATSLVRSGRSDADGIAAQNALVFTQTYNSGRRGVQDIERDENNSSGSSRVADANRLIIEVDGKEYTCNKGDVNCFFTNETVYQNGDISCNNLDCTLVGNTATAVNEENSEIINALANLSESTTNLNPLGDDAYCSSCMQKRFNNLENGDFTAARQEVGRMLQEKMFDKLTERALFNHTNYLEQLMDMNGVASIGRKDSESPIAMPADAYCAEELQAALNAESCGSDLSGSKKGYIADRNKKIVARVLAKMGIEADANSLTGEKVVQLIEDRSNERTATRCDGKKSVNRSSGRDRYARHKFGAWLGARYNRQRSSLNEIMKTFISVPGVHNHQVQNSLKSICSKSSATLANPNLKTPQEEIAAMTANYMNMYIDKMRSGEINCNAKSQANKDAGFTSHSIFYRSLCDDDGYNVLGSAVSATEGVVSSEKFNQYRNRLPASVRDTEMTEVYLSKKGTPLSSAEKSIRAGFIQEQTSNLLAAGMNMDPRINTVMGSWDNLCGAYKAYQNDGERVNFDAYVDGVNDPTAESFNEQLTSLRNSNCARLNKELSGIMCKDVFDIDPERGNIQSVGGINFNSEDVADAVNELGEELPDHMKVALASYSCEIRSSMIKNQDNDSPSERFGAPSNVGLLGSTNDRAKGEVSDLERQLNKITDDMRPDFVPGEQEGGLCNEDTQCAEFLQIALNLGQAGVDCKIDPETTVIASVGGGASATRGTFGRSGNNSGGDSGWNSFADSGSSVGSSERDNSGTPSRNNVGVAGSIAQSSQALDAAGVRVAGTAGSQLAAGTTDGVTDRSFGLSDSNKVAGEGTDLLGGFTNPDGTMGSFNGPQGQKPVGADMTGYEQKVSALQDKQREQMLADQTNQDSGNIGRGPASIAAVDELDIANMSEDELQALSDRLGIDVDELRKKAAKTGKVVAEDEDSALGKLLAEMREQNKSNQDIIRELQEQNTNLTGRLSRIESAASVSAVSGSTNNVVVPSGSKPVTASNAYKSNNFAFDLDSNTFQQRSTVTESARRGFSPDFASTGQNVAASNFSSYSDSRRSAIRSRSSDINQEFLTLVAGENGSYDNVETSKESVEKYVDFVNEKGGIYHLVKYDQSGKPVSIKVPWSSQEVPLTGEYATLINKIPPQSESLSEEESDYGMYKMVEFGQSLQQFFAQEATEQVQLSSLISELDSAEIQ